MLPIAYLNHWSGEGPAALRAQVHMLPPFEPLSLAGLRALLIPAHADQRYLMQQQASLQTFLQGAGTIVINGHIAYPFLPWLSAFVPSADRGLDGLRVHRAAPHPVFEGVDPGHLTFRRGVAGFYARGGNPPPSGARVLNTLGPSAQAIDWELRLPQGGRILMHSGNDLWMYAGSADSTGRLLPQLLAWLQGEAA